MHVAVEGQFPQNYHRFALFHSSCNCMVNLMTPDDWKQQLLHQVDAWGLLQIYDNKTSKIPAELSTSLWDAQHREK